MYKHNKPETNQRLMAGGRDVYRGQGRVEISVMGSKETGALF